MQVVPVLRDRIDSSKKMVTRDRERASNAIEDLIGDCMESPAGSGCASEGKEVEKNDKTDNSLRFFSTAYNDKDIFQNVAAMPEDVEGEGFVLSGFEASLL